METLSDEKFKQDYASHLLHLKLKGLRPKTIDAYSRAIRDRWTALLCDVLHLVRVVAARRWQRKRLAVLVVKRNCFLDDLA